MKSLNLEQMEKVQGGLTKQQILGCGLTGTGVMAAAIETGPFALLAGVLTYGGCLLAAS